MIVSSSYPFSRSDFRALFVHQMAVALVDAGASVRVLTPATGEEQVPRREVWQGVAVHRFAYPGVGLPALRLTGGDGMWQRLKTRPATGLSAPGLLTTMIGRVRAEVADLQPDLVIAHWLLPTAVACALAMAGSRRGQPTLLALGHGSDVHLLGRLPGGGSMLKALARRATMAATSAMLAQRVREIGGLDDVAALPLPVPTPLPGQSRAWRQDGTLRLGCLGRVLPDKGLEKALQVLEMLPEATLDIAGDGSAKEHFEAIIAQRGLQARMLGPLIGDQKTRFLNGLDVLLFLPDPRPTTAFGDNLPVSILEALTHGVPVFATRVGAMPTLLAHGGGVLVPPDPEAIAGALLTLDPAATQELRKQAREAARAHSPAAALAQLKRVVAGT